MKKFWLAFLILVVAAAAATAWAYRHSSLLAPYLGTHAGASQQLVNSTTFTCDQGKTIRAAFYQGPAPTVQPASTQGGPPQPNGSVELTLSDGRQFDLSQTISGSGIRYANQGESVVFWSAGNTAFMQESGTTTYSGCITASNLAGQESWTLFASSTMDLSFKYPPGWTLDPSYAYGLGPGQSIPGAKVTIPASMATGTNLGSDSYVSFETLPASPAGTTTPLCSASRFFGQEAPAPMSVTDTNGTTYSVASTTGAGAGNRYEEWVWALPGTRPCTAVRYFIHYGVIQNYPPGAVQQFDEQALLNEFDSIRRSLIIGRS